MTPIEELQVVNACIAFIGLLIWVIWAAKNKAGRLYAIAPITWLLHSMVFYTLIFLRNFADMTFAINFTSWSSVLRLHAVILICGIGLLMVWDKLVLRSK